MTTIEDQLKAFQFNRGKTLGLLEKIEQDNELAALGWRPGTGRAHIAWQLMHVAITEEIFATERLLPTKAPSFVALWPRYRGGSVPDDLIPTPDEIRALLNESRKHLVETLATYDDSRLGEIPPPMRERGLTVHDILHLIAWHEAHHQGQAHLTYNLYRARAR